jgi:hypothetical protein
MDVHEGRADQQVHAFRAAAQRLGQPRGIALVAIHLPIAGYERPNPRGHGFALFD